MLINEHLNLQAIENKIHSINLRIDNYLKKYILTNRNG
jgi:hypothetical protein